MPIRRVDPRTDKSSPISLKADHIGVKTSLMKGEYKAIPFKSHIGPMSALFREPSESSLMKGPFAFTVAARTKLFRTNVLSFFKTN